jgi:squalene-associated FAD-dependent desaturase
MRIADEFERQHMHLNSCDTDVAIIGGGIAGLTCAFALRESGLRVSVFESSSNLFGRASSSVDDVTGDVVDLGPHIFLTEYRNVLALLDEIGARDRIDWQLDPLIRMTEGSRASDMRISRLTPPFHLLPSFAKVPALSWRDLFSNRKVLRQALQFDEARVLELDAISAADYLSGQGVSKAFIDWFWASACLAVMNVTLDECSAGALMRLFAQLIGRHEYHIGFAKTGLADVFSPLLQSLRACDTRVLCDTRVRSFEITEGRAAGLTLSDGKTISARFVVSAIEAHELQKILPAHLRDMNPFDGLDAFKPVPYVSTYLWFDRKLSEQKFWGRVWNPHDLNCDFYDLSNIRPGPHRGSLIAANSIHCPRVHTMTDDEVIAGTVREIGDLIPQAFAAKVIHARVHRLPMAIARPAPGTERLRPQAITPIENLLLAGDWTRTLLPCSMESAAYSGMRAAEVIWNSLGQSRTLVIPKAAPEGLTGWVNRMTA